MLDKSKLRTAALSTRSLLAFAAALILGACTNSVPAVQSDDPSGSSFRVTPRGPTVVEIKSHEIASPGVPAVKMAEMKRLRLKRSLDKTNPHLLGTLAPVVSPVLASRVTFAKSAILNRSFLYGADLQNSTVGEEDGMLLQSIANGHVTTKFQVIGERLQLVTDQSYRFESKTGGPTRLLHEWPILHQSPNEITVDITKGSPTLAGFFGASSTALTSWVRSVEFISQGSYLLIESSVELADGNVAEFMESLFPRETLVNPSSSPVYDDASLGSFASRFGFLSTSIWVDRPEGRTRTAVAKRFSPPAPGETIDWYVTANIPQEFLPAVKAGIEGWNRYSQKMWSRDFVRFMGHLPAGIKIGDPRFNIVNWDSVADASSAYESQAADPETGLQSHSLIYLPYAWIKIGENFWKTGRLTQDRTKLLKTSIDRAQFLGENLQVPCFNEGELATIHIEMRDTPEQFSKDLLRGVVFHEVGHALGLAHNFKGSLEWEPDKKDSLVTSSIMDYNQYAVEGSVFDGVSPSSGPLLEYDRQALSVLYNQGKDISQTDPIVPFCDDAAANSRDGGVDPFCLQFDAGREFDLHLERTFQLIQDPTATLGKTKSLAVAAAESISTLGDPASIVTEADLLQNEMVFKNQLRGLIQYYFSSGGQGLSYTLSSRLPSLLVFRADSVPTDVDQSLLRLRIANVMSELMQLESFSSATHAAFAKTGNKVAQWVQQTPWYQSADVATRTVRVSEIKSAMTDVLTELELSLIPRVRTSQLQALTRTSTAPFFLSPSADYEAVVLDWLQTVLVDGRVSGQRYTMAERTAAAKTLSTFEPIPRAGEIKAAARALVDVEIRKSANAEERELLRALLAIL